MSKQLGILETERLVLRPFTLADTAQVQALAGDRCVYATTLNVPHPYADGMAEKWIASHAAQFFNDEGITLAVTLKDGGQLVGTVCLTAAAAHRRAELGYWIGVPFWGRGYCTEAARALIAYGFEVLGYHKIKATHFKVNPASGRVMEKAGMRREGELIDEVLKDGAFHTLVTYGIVAGAG